MSKLFNIGMSLGVLSAVIAFSESAKAVPISYTPTTFNFQGVNNVQAPSFVYNNVPHNLSVTVASNVASEPSPSPAMNTTVKAAGKVGKWTYGLGILDGSKNDAHFVDGKDKNDVLSFAFSQRVKLIAITFSFNDANHSLINNFALFFDKDKNNSFNNNLVWKSKDIPGSSFYGTYTFTALEQKNYNGKVFGIGAFGDNDMFKVASITVQQVSSIPLPGALPLILSGLVGLGLARQKKFA